MDSYGFYGFYVYRWSSIDIPIFYGKLWMIYGKSIGPYSMDPIWIVIPIVDHTARPGLPSAGREAWHGMIGIYVGCLNSIMNIPYCKVMFGILKKESWPQVGIDIQLWILNDIWEIILYETANIKFPLHMASKLFFFSSVSSVLNQGFVWGVSRIKGEGCWSC